MPRPAPASAPPRRLSRGRLVGLIVLAALVVLWRPASAHVRAASLLARFTDPDAHGLLADAARHPVAVTDFPLAGTRGRLYVPSDVDVARGTHVPGVVIVHGVHWKGIDEPRLQRFATTIAASGVAVLTPEIRELCDYRIDPASIDTIGASAQALAARLGGAPVGVMGLSFAGGLSLIAATEPRYASSFAFVVAVGAHDDLGRVLRFFTSNESPRPDGTTLHIQAHDYGQVVLVYSHVEDFFPAADVPVARDTLRSWLHEDFDDARARAAALSPEAGAFMKQIFDHSPALAPLLDAEVARLAPQLAAVSPSAHLAGIRVPVFLLHGAGDRVIPSSETEWLAHDTPRGMLRAALVSPAIEHVELESGTSLADELALVHFMGDVLDAADDR
ncbi:MAG: alpha/beta hydrolase [Polyangiaceae bacterium]